MSDNSLIIDAQQHLDHQYIVARRKKKSQTPMSILPQKRGEIVA